MFTEKFKLDPNSQGARKRGCAGKKLSLVLALLSACLSAHGSAEPPLAASVCAGCHGPGGVSTNPHVPSLAGQPYTLIEDSLIAFRSGKRACSDQRLDDSVAGSLGKSMCFQVKQLEDAEISALAQWFESRGFEPVSQQFDQELAAEGSVLHERMGCDRCHADGGRESLGMAPVLAGQWMPFLRRAMHAIRSGDRSGPVMMNAPIRQLDDRQIDALLNYYASQGDQSKKP